MGAGTRLVRTFAIRIMTRIMTPSEFVVPRTIRYPFVCAICGRRSCSATLGIAVLTCTDFRHILAVVLSPFPRSFSVRP